MVKLGEAFIVSGHYNGELLTAALFIYRKKYCYYGVGASDRRHSDKPLSHAIIWEAILHAKSLGISFFELGEQIFQNENKDYVQNKKEFGISEFKKWVWWI